MAGSCVNSLRRNHATPSDGVGMERQYWCGHSHLEGWMDGGQPDPGWQRELVGRAAFLPPLGVRCAFAEIKIWPRRRLVQFLACMVRARPHASWHESQPAAELGFISRGAVVSWLSPSHTRGCQSPVRLEVFCTEQAPSPQLQTNTKFTSSSSSSTHSSLPSSFYAAPSIARLSPLITSAPPRVRSVSPPARDGGPMGGNGKDVCAGTAQLRCSLG